MPSSSWFPILVVPAIGWLKHRQVSARTSAMLSSKESYIINPRRDERAAMDVLVNLYF